MQIVLLCGGKGTRLKEVSNDLPKGMIEINKKPFLHYILNSLKDYNFKSIHFCLGYKSEIIINFLENNKFSIPITYAVEEQNKLLGTGGALKNSLEFLDKSFVVQYGDTLLNLDYKYLFKCHLQKGKQLTMTTISTDLCNHEANMNCKKLPNGQLHCRYEKNNRLSSFKYVDYGAMVMEREILQLINKDSFDLSLIQERLTRSNDVNFIEVFQPFVEIGSPQTLNYAKKILHND